MKIFAPVKYPLMAPYTLEDGFAFTGTGFPGFDAAELAYATGAASVRVDFALGQSHGSRHGEKPSVEIIYEIEGIFNDGQDGMMSFQLAHPEGQAYLTATGVAIGTESLLQGEEKPSLYLAYQKI